MKSVSTSLLSFFSVYVPSTAVIGLLAGAFQAPGMARSVSYELFLWFVVAVQMLIPTLLALYVVILFVKLLQRFTVIARSAMALKVISVLLAGLVLPSAQALAWGVRHVSVDGFLIAVLPAAALGLMLVQNASNETADSGKQDG